MGFRVSTGIQFGQGFCRNRGWGWWLILLASGWVAGVSAADTWSTGAKPVLVMPVIFPDAPSPPATTHELTAMTGAITDFFTDNSYGQLSLQPEVTPILMMPHPVVHYETHPDRHDALRADARSVALQAGFAVTDYPLDVVLNGRLFADRANRGLAGCWLRSADPDIAIHELGHNLGLGHADLWVGRGDTRIGPGRAKPYGNMLDAMADHRAGTWPDRQFNVVHKQALGWLPRAQVRHLTNSGTYRLHAFDTPTLQPSTHVAFHIATDAGRDYWIEARQRWLTNQWVQQGVLVNMAPRSTATEGSMLVDMTPNTHWLDDSLDAALVVGRTFSDHDAGIHITPWFRRNTPPVYADIHVVLGDFPENQPPVAAWPEAPLQTVPGAPVLMTVDAFDADGDLLAFGWERGRQPMGANTNAITMVWNEPGEYMVRCQVSDMKGGVAHLARVVRVGNPDPVRITGRVTRNGEPLAGVRVSLTSSHVAYTDANGHYTAVGVLPGTYQLHPGHPHHEFDPPARVVVVTNGVSGGQDFDALWTATPNNPPYVVTTDPWSESTFGALTSVALRAWVHDDGIVQMVQFTAATGLGLLGKGNSFDNVWTNQWEDAPVGEHVIQVQAVDEFGRVGQALPTPITIMPSSPRLEGIQRRGDGSVVLDISGVTGAVQVETSTNLLDWNQSVVLSNVTGTIQWTDPEAASHPGRYYRLRVD